MDKYFAIQKTDDSNEATSYSATTTHKNFVRGHFPNQPISPAYSLSILASECLSLFLNNSAPLNTLKIFSSKFVNPASPDKTFSVAITQRIHSKIEVKISQEQQVCSTLIYNAI